MSPEQQARLFDLQRKSTRGTAGEKGSGLGLVLVKELTSLNKGAISVQSTLEKGTTFALRFKQNEE